MDRPLETPVDRTKTSWVAGVHREFGRPKTTVAALYYFALGRKDADYPICGGFVGEIRAMRRYHETDCPKLEKWVGRAKLFGRLPQDAILPPLVGEFIPPEAEGDSGAAGARRPRIELWMARPGLAPLVLPVCQRMDAALVSFDGQATAEAIGRLVARARTGSQPTLVLCLSDLSPSGIVFCRDLALQVKDVISSGGQVPEIRVVRIGLSPRQVLNLGIPAIPGKAGSKEEKTRYVRYVKPQGLDPDRIAEIDALEAYHRGGIAGFVEEAISRFAREVLEAKCEGWLLQTEKGVLSCREDLDVSEEI